MHSPVSKPGTPSLNDDRSDLTFAAEGGAGDGVRTRDIQLGRLTLCQLSYSRRRGRVYQHLLAVPGTRYASRVSATGRTNAMPT